MLLETKHFYEFKNFRLDIDECVLLRGGKPLPVTPKVFHLLKILVEHHGHLVEKDKLISEIWADSFVEDGNLTFNIRMLRKALGDEAAHPTFIETVPRRGYRFIAEVEEFSETAKLNDVVPRPSVQPSENNLAAFPKSRNFPASVPLALVILLTAAIGIGSWYAQSKNHESDAPVLSAPFALEKLSTNGKVRLAIISPDGKNMFYVNEISGRYGVWLRQLESTNNVEIIPPSDDFYGGLALSPDGNFLYFARHPLGIEGQLDIYRISIFGGVPTKIVGETQGWTSLSPDGEKISFVRCYYREDENCSLWIADSFNGKNERKLVSRPRPIRIGDNKFSPDGNSIAFAVGQSENQANEFALMEVDLASGAERELTAEKFFNIKRLAWLPAGKGLLFTASRVPNRNFRIWQVSADATGSDAQPLTNDSESYADLSLDKNARFLVSTQVKEEFRLRLFEMENPSVSRVLADANGVAFAPDGKVIFTSGMSGNEEIWSIDPEGGRQKQLMNNAADESAPIVSPDNNSIFFASNRTGEVHVWRMNADGSNQTQITENEGGFPLLASPGGRWLFYHSGRDRTLRRVSIQSGEEQSVINKSKYRFAISPDGLQAAFSEKAGDKKVLTVVSLADGRTIKNFALPDETARLFQIRWLPGENSLVYILANNKIKDNTLWLQPFGEETPRQITDLGAEDIAEMEGFALAPDGKSFAVAQGGWKHDAVLLKGLR